MTPDELRRASAGGEFDRPTAGYCKGYVQANMVALPAEYAADFEDFCRKNPKPCPLLEVVGPGSYKTAKLVDGADLRREIPRYTVFIDGKPVHSVQDMTEFYRDDLVFFLLGCSFTFETALLEEGIPLRHVSQNKNVSMYKTNIPLESAGVFHGEMVVSMRPIRHELVVKATLVTSHFPEMHGAPVHVGYPEMIGIKDIHHVDYGDSVEIQEGETPVFWACGVTPQNVLLKVAPPLAITHSPGFMLVSDLRHEHYYQENCEAEAN